MSLYIHRHVFTVSYENSSSKKKANLIVELFKNKWRKIENVLVTSSVTVVHLHLEKVKRRMSRVSKG